MLLLPGGNAEAKREDDEVVYVGEVEEVDYMDGVDGGELSCWRRTRVA